MTEVSDWFSKHGGNYPYLPREWSDYYANAMRINRFFKCERCNHCCIIPAEICPEDIVRIAHHLNKSVNAFIEEFVTEHDDGSRYLNYPCPFLTERGCRIYQVRPLSCALYPFRVTFDHIAPKPNLLRIAILDISGNCKLSNKIFFAFNKLCGKEISEIPLPEYIKTQLKEKDRELDRKLSKEDPYSLGEEIIFSLQTLNLFVKRLQSRHDTF